MRVNLSDITFLRKSQIFQSARMQRSANIASSVFCEHIIQFPHIVRPTISPTL